MSSISVAPEGIEPVDSDLGPLAWVLDELRKSLDGATKAMRRFVRDAELARGSDLAELDASQLRIARQQLHQAVGALEMVGLGVPAKVLRAMEALAQKFIQRPELCSEDAAGRMERASFALTEYLEGVLKGKAASSVALFPQYSGVLELADADRVHPADLWPVEWRWADVALPPSVDAVRYAPTARAQLDQWVLKVVKTADQAAAKRLAKLCLGFAAGHEVGEHARTFWAVGAGYFEAIALGLCPADIYTKRASSRVLQQYASLARGDAGVSERLALDLLFFCSLAMPGPQQKAPALLAVQKAFGLTPERKVDYHTEQFGRYDPAQLVLTRKRIATAAETWSSLAGGDVNRLKVVAEQFSALSESIVKLHPESGALAAALTHAIESTVRSGNVPVPTVAMEVATSVLYLEAAYEDLDPTETHMADRSARLAQRLGRVVDGQAPEPLEAWMEELYRRVSDRQTMGSVVDELRTALAQVEKSLDQFFRNPADKSPLHEVPSQLAQMRGVFSVLGLDQPALAALRMRSSAEQFLVDEIDAESARTGIFEKLGNTLGAMGFLIDMLSYQRSLAKKLFVYDEELGELKSLMGRERSAVPVASPKVSEPAAAVALSISPAPEPAPVTVPAAAQEAKIIAPAPAVPVAPPAHIDADDDQELKDIFLEEAREVVHTGLDAIKALAVDPSNLADQTTLRRAFHTLKGSSRMVGFTDFGEAAWSFEQLLNTWLAEQRPASDELIGLASSAMHGFARWIDDIATGDASAWRAEDFRASSDGLRVQGVVVPLSTPGQAAAVETSTHAVLDAAMQDDVVELPVLEVPDLAPTAAPQDFASTQLSDSLGLSFPTPSPDFAATQLHGGLSALEEPSEPRQQDFQSTQTFDFEATAAFDHSQKGGLAASSTEVNELDLGDFDFGDLGASPAQPPAAEEAPQSPEFSMAELSVEPAMEAEAESAQEPELAAEIAPAETEVDAVLDHLEFPADQTIEAEPAMEMRAAVETVDVDAQAEAPAEIEPEAEAPIEIDEGVKVIGPLRLSIPLYNVYLNEADEWSRRLQVEISEWAMELDKPIPDLAVTLAHSLLGSSATVGFSSLSELARALEHALQHVQLHHQGTPELAQVFSSAAEDVRRLLHQFAAGFLKDADASIVSALNDIIATEFPQAEELPEPELAEEIIPVVEEDLVAEDAQVTQESIQTQLHAPVHAPVPAPVQRAAASDEDDDIDAVDSLDPDLLPIFEEEAAELMPLLGAALRQWVEQPDNLGARGEILRVLHTLKGSARLAGAMRLGEMAHRMESNIEHIGSEFLQSIQLEPLLGRYDHLQDTLANLGKTPAEEMVSVETSAAPLDASEPTAPETPAEQVATPTVSKVVPLKVQPMAAPLAPVRANANQSVRVRSHLLDRLVNQAGEVMITRARMDARLGQVRASLSELTGNLDRLRNQLRDVELQAESQMQSRMAQSKDTAQGFDPLEFDRFTRVQELTRMMAESVHDVATVQRNLMRSVEGTEDDLIAQGRQARELQRDLLRTRMMEFEGISERLYGVVRQAGKDAAKQVRLDIVGGTIEMDRGILDRMGPAFEHILRNCVAHGIESAEARTAAGKSAAGTITISVHQESNDVTVAFADDGGGLHLDKIREKALAKGLITADQVLTDAQAADLIFSQGFSTADQVTELAGRGIGMDVVRSEVNALGGRIETLTVPGKGTTFKLVLPLTTAVTQVVMLRIGEFTIGVPSNLMETVLRAPADAVTKAYATDSFDFGGEAIPFFWGGALLQVSAGSTEAQAKTLAVAVMRSAGQRIALHVDEVLGNREVVVKNLGPQLSRLPGLAGVSVLASGAVVLIYNPVALAAVYADQARQLRHSVATPAGDATAAATAQGNMQLVGASADLIPLVLVVDDSITVRRVTQRLLKREGYRVALAADGLQALERLQEERPAVVLSDIEMPRMDGFDLARNIRGDSKLRDLPIIMITSRIAEKHREHARELGVDHYLGKPYSEDELLRLVRSYCTAPEEVA